MKMSEYEVRENYRQLKFALMDAAEQSNTKYRLFRGMGRQDLADQALEAVSQLEEIIKGCGLTEEYTNYCRMGGE